MYGFFEKKQLGDEDWVGFSFEVERNPLWTYIDITAFCGTSESKVVSN